MAQSIEKSIVAVIYGNGRGWAFSQIDFASLGSRKAVDAALIRLTDKASIRRVMRGIYDYPRYSDLLQKELSPDMHQVARALARKFGWRIAPSGPAAMNLIGLSTQVPGQYVYQSDGPNRSYDIGKTTLAFKHQALKESGFRLEESGIVVQAIKTLGQEHLTAQMIHTIRDWLPAGKRLGMLKDTRRVTGWVYEAIKQICQEHADG